MIEFAQELARMAGASLMDSFGAVQDTDRKGDASNVVTAADLRSEQLVVESIRRSYPSHSVIAEETGVDLRDSEYTWVIDPLDGTSNYAAGIPWFGVLIAVLKQQRTVAAVMYLPAANAMYSAERGGGAFKNGSPISVTAEPRLDNVLWAYGMDGGGSQQEADRNVALLAVLLRRVRNIRATNSLVDAALTADGRLGGMLNHNTRLWDIVAPQLIIEEAGGCYTDVRGQALQFDLGANAADREYAVLAAAPGLHREVSALVAEMMSVPAVDPAARPQR